MLSTSAISSDDTRTCHPQLGTFPFARITLPNEEVIAFLDGIADEQISFLMLPGIRGGDL